MAEIKLKKFYGSEKLNLNHNNYRFAFTFKGLNDNEVKDSPKFVKIITRFWTLKFDEDGTKIKT